VAVGLPAALTCPPLPPHIEYRGRYDCQPGTVDHLLNVTAIGPDRAVVVGALGTALVDLSALPVGGTTSYLDRITGTNAFNALQHGSYLFINMHANGMGGTYGTAIWQISGDTLVPAGMISQPDTFQEKLAIDGDTLYVAAHDKGLSIYDITLPTMPTLLGSLSAGFTDAFAVAVDGTLAYVADGAGGLKVVDVTDPASPILLAGEDPLTAAGTAEAITVRAGDVYMAAGSAGLHHYPAGMVGARTTIPVGGVAEDLAWVGDLLVVAAYDRFVVLEVTSGTPEVVATELAGRRGPMGSLRICTGVGGASGNRLLAANWNSMDVYELVPGAVATQPDVDCVPQRLRFPPAGGTRPVTVSNDGSAPLIISSVTSSVPSFSTAYAGGTLLPGQSVTFDVTYNGSAAEGAGVVRLACNDPDESPMPIQVFGTTQNLDPTEPAVDFSLPILRRDWVSGGFIEETFTLSQHLGQVIWVGIYASW
jgi:hypothetical protein